MRNFLKIVTIYAVGSLLCPLHSSEVADLRGYGKVSADLTPNRAVFACESVAKADILLDKLLADLFWDETNPPRKSETKIGTATISIYSLPGQGSFAIARAGTNVVVLGAADEGQVTELVGKEPLLQGSDVSSQPQGSRPVYLDFYDNTSFDSYVPPMTPRPGFDLKSRWPFIKSLKGGETLTMGASFRNINPAPNVIDWSAIDYEIREAEQEKGLVMVKLWAGEAPLWVYNTDPDQMLRASDTTCLGEWGASMVGAHFPSWEMPVDVSQHFGLGFVREVMERYVSSPAVGGWMIEDGAPGDEYAFHDRATRSWDTSAAGQAGWRSWLKEVKGWSLSDLGTRWYGDPNHFTNWEQVMVPDPNEFFGQLGEDSFRLNSGWQIQNVDAMNTPPDETKWIPVAMPPSQQQTFFPDNGANYFQVAFDPNAWWKQQKEKGAKDVWLVFGATGTGDERAAVWWNNAPVELPKDDRSQTGPFAVRVTDLMQSGNVQLKVLLACAAQTSRGKLAGPVFLTVHEPKRLPYLGRQANARYTDLIEWQYWAMAEMIRNEYMLARKIDPDRSYVIAPGGGGDGNVDYACQLAADFGIGTEHSGREASYSPWWSGFGLVNGFYGTSEWSNFPEKNTPHGDSLARGFGWIMFDADSNHNLYGDPEFYMKRDQEDGWFTQHHRQIELFGKYLREHPKIVLFRSVESIRLTGKNPDWDLGRGEIQDAHYDEVYAGERELKAGMINDYPVLMDTGSQFMEPDVVAAIRRYVENGGTFIALQNTATHTALDPDSYPLASLTGFTVENKSETGKIRFETKIPIFKAWEGREFEGEGEFIDWLNTDEAKVGNVGFVSNDSSAVPLARWNDGRVAMGYRKVGKGQVIVLGSTFWRKGKDIFGVWETTGEFESQFLEELFTDCGISHITNASIPEIWTRKMVTKNGLQNWLLAFNRANADQKADVWMATDGNPDQVLDMETGTPVAFTFENGGISIKQVDFKPFEVKVFGVRRGNVVSGLSVWWHEKTTYWKKTPVQLAATNVVLPDARQKGIEDVIPLKEWQFKTDPDAVISKQLDWTNISYDDAQWQTVKPEPWTLLDPTLKDYHGTGLYRVKFTLPPEWSGRKMLLSLNSFDTPIVYDQGDFFINGNKVATYHAHRWSQTYSYDITTQVHPGDNVLALQVKGGEEFGGIGGAIWLESWTSLAPSLDLSGTWQAVRADYLTKDNAPVPGTWVAKYLTRDVAIPADWQGKTVFLEWSSNHQWVGCIVINGRPIYYNSYDHPYGLWSRVNVTPSLRAGKVNTIEIWPFTTTQTARVNEEKNCELNEIHIGCK